VIHLRNDDLHGFPSSVRLTNMSTMARGLDF